MLRVLIVDDEKIERDGIKLLVKKNKYNLELEEADNGEKALELLKIKPVDIIFTDIKMPFMGGLELAQKAREIYPDIKIIIFSAFGEFEYAKKAINVGVIHYILKPIDFTEFHNVFSKVIELCEKENVQQEKSKENLKLYEKGKAYEKEKLLLDMIYKNYSNTDLEKRAETAGIEIQNRYVQPILLDSKTKFFDVNGDSFELLLKENIRWTYEYINLNDRQSLIFILSFGVPIMLEMIKETLNHFLGEIQSQYGKKFTIVVGLAETDLGTLSQEYEKMEIMLEYRFFIEEGTILYRQEEGRQDNIVSQSMDHLATNIFNCIEKNDLYGLERSIDIFFEGIKGKDGYSSIYVKYTCIEIIKHIFEKEDRVSEDELKHYIEQIFLSERITDLEYNMKQIIAGSKAFTAISSDEVTKKAIKDILQLLDENYRKDISLEWIAEKVYLTPSYVSYLFKKEVGQSFVKYLTSYRLQKAAELLKNTNMKIMDIAEKVGYSNTSYFTLSFKKNFGVTPADFREGNENDIEDI